MVLQFERVLFVHAHPDDESISTGGTIAALAAAGVSVTVLTLTRGELGEVIPAELGHLSGDALGAHRASELAAALAELGATGRQLEYRDSGMQWGENGAESLDTLDQRSLCAAPLASVVADITAVIEETGADAVVSYDATGGYGHPDHIRAHEAARRAAADLPFYVIDPEGSISVEGLVDAKRAALAAHRTQLRIVGDEFELSNGTRWPIGAPERFQLLARIESLPL